MVGAIAAAPIRRLNFILILYYIFLTGLNYFVIVNAIPRRGNEPWTLILCKFADLSNYEPRPPYYFQQWLSGSHPDSIENYFSQLSNGIYTIKGSNVIGWITMPYTQKDILRLINADAMAPLGSSRSFDYFDKIKDVCIETAQKSGNIVHPQRITIINSGTTAVYGKNNGVLLTPQLMFSSVLTHEMVHSFFIGHSYSDRRIKVFPYAALGEYDDRYDLLSTANAYMHRSTFGMSGPGLNGAHLDFLGWLPMDRVLYFGRDGRQNYTLRMSSLSVQHYDTKGWLLIMIPFDRDDPRNFYTIEFRTKDRYDRGILQPAVLIHRVQRAGSSYYSVLISQSNEFYELTTGTEWIQFLQPDETGTYQRIRVSVRRMYTNDVDITVSSTFDPTYCRMGEIRRMVMRTHYGLSSVCVPRSRAKSEITEIDLKRQYGYDNFFGHRLTFGANECKDGLVWRAIDAYDYVCVPPQRQQQVQAEAVAHRLRSTYSSNSNEVEGSGEDGMSTDAAVVSFSSTSQQGSCPTPYVLRTAFYGDETCVTRTEKAIADRENMAASRFLKHYEFFNGVDTIGP